MFFNLNFGEKKFGWGQYYCSWELGNFERKTFLSIEKELIMRKLLKDMNICTCISEHILWGSGFKDPAGFSSLVVIVTGSPIIWILWLRFTVWKKIHSQIHCKKQLKTSPIQFLYLESKLGCTEQFCPVFYKELTTKLGFILNFMGKIFKHIYFNGSHSQSVY